MPNNDSKSKTLFYLILLGAIFITGFSAIIYLDQTVENMISGLEKRGENERAAIAIGDYMMENIILIERNYFQIFPMRREASIQKNYAETQQCFQNIRNALEVLEFGGSINIVREMNLPNVQDTIENTLFYQPPPEKNFPLEVIDLKPKLLVLESHVDSLLVLVAKRNRIQAEGRTEEILPIMRQLDLAAKKVASHFVRMRENANRLYHVGSLNTQSLYREVESKKAFYNLLEIFIAIFLILLVLGSSGLVARQIIAVSKRLAQATEEAESASKAKSDFLASMSHEIRTPLNTIIGTSYLMSKGSLTDRQRHDLDTILVSAESLLVVINDVLDFSKIEAGELVTDPHPFSVSKVVSDLVTMFKPVARQKGLLFNCEPPSDWSDEPLIGDSNRLRQILINLLNNAFKFTKEGAVHIQYDQVHPQTDPNTVTLRFSVIDSGIGISKKNQEKLFERFSQVDSSTSRNYGGSGLGLSIVKNLAELMGGKSGVESDEGFGSNFWVELPFKVLSSEELAQDVGRTTPGEGSIAAMSIMIVDDSQLNLDLTERVLVEEGALPMTCLSGEEALTLLEENPDKYDLILMDLQMPGLGGMETSGIIRQKLGLSIPIIALTAGATTTQRNEAEMAGMNDFITKPIKPDTLVEFLSHYFHVRGISPTSPAPVARADDDQPDVPADIDGEESTQDEWPELEGFETEDTKKLTRGDLTFFRTILTMFVDDVEDFVKKINYALEAGDLETATHLAHKIRGQAGQLGAMKLHRYAAELEDTLQESGQASTALIRKLTASHHTVMTSTKQWLNDQSESTS